MTRDGKTWHWCPKHVHPHGKFNGLYCLHTPENHDEWKAKYRKGSAQPAPAAAPATDAPAKQKLALNQRIKEVLCTKLMISDDDTDKVCKEIAQEN